MQGYCQTCYKYFIIDNKEIYPLPLFGEITYTKTGDCICPFCGKAFRKLGNHFRHAHGILSKQAHKQAGWDANAKATNADYRKLMKKRLQKKCVINNLLKKGVETRYKKGYKGRTKDQVSQMTSNRLKYQFKTK